MHLLSKKLNHKIAERRGDAVSSFGGKAKNRQGEMEGMLLDPSWAGDTSAADAD